ncbi:MAG TPA: RNA methyltransferase [Crinalium sp.]|jgi:tRNA/rRNA methyltransferase
MIETVLSGIRIVLVEPAGPLNVGAIARIMKNMGLQRLVLVNPQCDPLGAEARQMAVHAADVLETAQQVASLPDALRGCYRALATTGRDRTTLDITLEDPRTALPWLLSSGNSPNNTPDNSTHAFTAIPVESALIFGREDRGLTNEELNYAQRFIRIPSTSIYPSLNLAQAVAICCYELHLYVIEGRGQEAEDRSSAPHTPYLIPDTLFRSQESGVRSQESGVTQYPTPNTQHASLDRLEGYYQQLESLLLKIGYLYPHTASSRMEKFRRLFNRTYLSDTEVSMLRGILSQVEWALKTSETRTDDS